MRQIEVGLDNYKFIPDHHKTFRRYMNALLNYPTEVKVLPYPVNAEDYIEPTYGQCLALKSKDKKIIIQQADGSYFCPVAGDDKKIHRCHVDNEIVQQYL